MKLEAIEKGVVMTEEIELIRGGGNIYRDLERSDADVRQTKAILAANIISVLDERGWSTRKAEEMTGINHSEFSRIRRPRLERFTIDRLITVLNRLSQRVDVEIRVRPTGDQALIFGAE